MDISTPATPPPNRPSANQPGPGQAGASHRSGSHSSSLARLPLPAFILLVNNAFKSYQSLLALSRSPLAQLEMIGAALIADQVSPTTEERGRALRLLLQWAVNRLAPGPVAHPLGVYRPLDDPTWWDPLWWRYNILRHRYLEPLHPDEFVDGGRFTETLMARTGIPSPDTFFAERNRAIREVAQHLRQQLLYGEADRELRQLALDQLTRSLQAQPAAKQVLDIAATMVDIFPRELLLQMAREEQITHAQAGLDHLTRRRLLLASDGGELWLSPALREHIYARQPSDALRRRHRLVAQHWEKAGEPLRAAIHWQQAQQWRRAASLLQAAATDLVNELQIDELQVALARFQPGSLPPEQWQEVQILLADLHAHQGEQQEALAACRRALKATQDPVQRARVYRRMGKLYEKRNQRHALTYYQQALERFPSGHPEALVLRKDRGWLHILRQEWQAAETDLLQALAEAPEEAQPVRADIFDALASLYRHQQRYDQALSYAQRALALREELGEALATAKSFGNLGLLYRAMGDYDPAIAAYQEAMSTYQRLGNREMTATALLNIGTAHHLAGRLEKALTNYRESLALCQETGLPLAEAKLHSNLAEALAQMGNEDEARRHWLAGYQLSRHHGFDDQVAYFRQIQADMPAFQGLAPAEDRAGARGVAQKAAAPILLDPQAEAALELARRAGRITARDLMKAAGISKATATRRLASLCAEGLLEKRGRGRGVHYVLAGVSGVGSRDPGAQQAVQEPWAELLARRSWLEQIHGIVALGILGELPQEGSRFLCLMLRFQELPALTEFLALEQWFSQTLGLPVDLKVATLTDPQTRARVHWLW